MIYTQWSFTGCAVSHDPSQRREFSKPGDSPPPPREIDSQELMQGSREIVIRHGTEAYRLSVTRAGKLILRK
jgi:hemin uptake protein HemP